MNLHYPPCLYKINHKISRPQWKKKSEIYEKNRILSPQHPTSPLQTVTKNLPPEPTLNILPTKVDLHVLLALSIRINRAHHPLRPLQRAFVALLRLLAHESDQVARHHGALALGVAKVLLDAAAQRVDAFAHFFGVVVVGQEVAASFAG